jgi:hypothetical protein
VLDLPPSPRPLEAPVTVPLKLSKAGADSTCEQPRDQAGEAVLVLGSNLRAASICFEIQFRIPYVMREWTGSRRE